MNDSRLYVKEALLIRESSFLVCRSSVIGKPVYVKLVVY